MVLLLVRNALGVQQIPPNMALNALAIIMSGYIMAPVIVQTFDILSSGQYGFASVDEVTQTFNASKGPLIEWLSQHTHQRELTFFIEAAGEIWPPSLAASATDDNLAIIMPAFVVSQLREAFEIGFLLYLPFIAIDLIVSNILLAMGMMMVSPLTISLPFKLFLFVMVDGWSRLILGLIMTYAN